MDNCSPPWAVFYLWLYVAKDSALHHQPLLLLLCCLLLCAWFWSFSFQKNIQNEWAEEGAKRESQSNWKRLSVSVDPASPPEAGGGGVNPVCISHGLSFCPTVRPLRGHNWPMRSGPSDSHSLKTPSGLRPLLSVSLSLCGQAFQSFLSLHRSF